MVGRRGEVCVLICHVSPPFLLPRPSVLDSFSATVGHFSTLMKQLSSDKTPPLSNRIIIPLQVSSERDPELEVYCMHCLTDTLSDLVTCTRSVSVEISLYFQRGTENRLSVLHHEVGKCSTSSMPQPILISLPPPQFPTTCGPSWT